MKSNNDLVSILMPAYNSSRWIEETIRCVQAQTYVNWELIIADDASFDNTVQKVESLMPEDSRLRLLKTDVNRGAGNARNRALQNAKGRYIAYLDSDDLWIPEKLEHQLNYMRDFHYVMCYTDYDIVDENGVYRKTVHVPETVNYEQYLRRPITCSHSVMFDTDAIDKRLLIMPDIRRGQDGATWLQVLKTGVTGHALGESLAKYRRHKGSLSNNKLNAVKRMWYLYRKVEKLSFFYSSVCFISYAFSAVKKYI